MGRILGPKCRLCRREGEKLFLKGERCHTSKCAITRRKYAPGMHGAKSGARLSDWGMQLRAKQKAKRIYHIGEAQFRIYFGKAYDSSEDTGEALLKQLEIRLDNVVFRLGFVSSRLLARQMVNHGFITVNGDTVTIPSFQVKPGDVIRFKDTKKETKLMMGIANKKGSETKSLPSWIVFDADKKESKILNLPKREDFIENVDDKLIVEFYSK
ncbi:MAG: small subunit ribosomal protein S4 [Parcubacteria group bacterium Gr01-1014_18]|nr:MAG: small subunit ribosomal protein S4 [Parcubacteria group bacterium Greene0416_36]TSC80134.1 MAG: small subunit ribosomal protein S4 [Parcubacteria group bacterium Gr01-1014_18]TSC99348.1 MAG: small subunit ribosomal protein S4 [Parcubacteria group bacterium Greene1014_20]TSD06815.1 MAG: small subunit ribosomal protein S4 [Parcubacteria group bacterium Greene0714_2]